MQPLTSESDWDIPDPLPDPSPGPPTAGGRGGEGRGAGGRGGEGRGDSEARREEASKPDASDPTPSVAGSRYKSPEGERLARILSDLGFASWHREGTLDLRGVANLLRRRGMAISHQAINKWVYEGYQPNLRTAAAFARILKFDIRDWAYEEPPKGLGRRKGKYTRGVLDEIDREVW